MEKLNGVTKKGRILSILAFILALLVVIPTIVITKPVPPEEGAYLELNSHCDLVVDGILYKDITMNTFSYPMRNRGDVVEYKFHVDETSRIQSPVLKIYSIHSAVNVYIDNSLIYNYGDSRYRENKLLGYGYHYVKLPPNYGGKDITIQYIVSENNAFTGLPSMAIANMQTILQMSLGGDRIRFSIALFLILFGAITMFITAVMMLKSPRFAQLFCIALFAILIGLWTLCNNDMISYFTHDMLVKVYMEYLCIYALPIPFLLYFYDRGTNPKGRPVIKYTFWSLLVLQGGVFLVALFSQLLGGMHLPQFLTIAHLLTIGDVAFLVMVAIQQKPLHNGGNKGLRVGMIIVMMFLFYELIRYNIDKYILQFQLNEYNSILCFGALIVVISLMIDFVSRIAGNLYIEAQQELLESMAYTDKLTGLANRRKCDDMVSELEKEQKNYAIISMDLNLLKHYNDTYGHEKGDELLRCFAECLQTIFEEPILTGRTGGDEFVAIIPDANMVHPHSLILKLQKELACFNENHNDMMLSVATGYAFRRELGEVSDGGAVMRKADERMYECKREMKEKTNSLARSE